jgi:hypothetical protein
VLGKFRIGFVGKRHDILRGAACRVSHVPLRARGAVW